MHYVHIKSFNDYNLYFTLRHLIKEKKSFESHVKYQRISD